MRFTFRLQLPDGVDLQACLVHKLEPLRGPEPYEVLVIRVVEDGAGWLAQMWLNPYFSPKLVQAQTHVEQKGDWLELTVEPHRVSEKGAITHVFCDLWLMGRIAHALSKDWETPVTVLGESFETLERLDVEVTPEAMPFYRVCAGED